VQREYVTVGTTVICRMLRHGAAEGTGHAAERSGQGASSTDQKAVVCAVMRAEARSGEDPVHG
jgi:hypothetical protein